MEHPALEGRLKALESICALSLGMHLTIVDRLSASEAFKAIVEEALSRPVTDAESQAFRDAHKRVLALLRELDPSGMVST